MFTAINDFRRTMGLGGRIFLLAFSLLGFAFTIFAQAVSDSIHNPPQPIVSPEPSTNQPRIACEEATFDFGSKDASELVAHTFVLKNTGTADLVITAVRPACGCTAAALGRSTIPPGESTELSAKLSLSGRNGEVHKPITIESNDPANPAFQLALRGNITTDFQITPNLMVLRKERPDAPATVSVIIKSSQNKPFEILGAKSEGGKIKLRWDKFSDENSYQLTANLEEALEPGQYGDKITIETNHPTRKNLDINLVIVVPSPIVVAPTKIVLDSTTQAPVSRTIILKNPSKDTLTIDKIETPDPSMTTKVETMGNFGAKVTLGNINPTPVLVGQEIRIILASGQEIRVPFELKAKP